MFRFLFIIPLLVLGGCGYLTPATTAISTGVEKYCAAPIERATLRAGLSPEAFSKDWAICLRCSGEEALSGCIGNPKGLPPQ